MKILFLSIAMLTLTRPPSKTTISFENIGENNYCQRFQIAGILQNLEENLAKAAVRRMPNTNHQQMRNCSQTKSALNDLLNGDIPNAWYFECDER